MQKLLTFVLAAALLLSASGCASSTTEPEPTPPVTQIANPWTDWSSIEEAELAVGFSFGLPDTIADRYTVKSIRTMNNVLMEVTYHDDGLTVCVRKQLGEGQDISGDYNQYETCSETNFNGGSMTGYSNSADPAIKQLISYQGYSWSLVAPNGYGDDSGEAFLSLIRN